MRYFALYHGTQRIAGAADWRTAHAIRGRITARHLHRWPHRRPPRIRIVSERLDTADRRIA